MLKSLFQLPLPAFFLLAACIAQSPPEQIAKPRLGPTLTRLINEAKQQSRTVVDLGLLIPMETGVESVQEITRDYGWLRFHVTRHFTSIADDRIFTCYLVQIDEVIQWKGFTPDATSPDLCQPLKPKANQALILEHGGEVLFEGILIRQPSTQLRYRLVPNQSYVAGVHTEPASLRLVPAAGINSIFTLDRNMLSPLGSPTHPIARSMAKKYSNSYNALIGDIKQTLP
jgi:hypothetical protein